MKSLLRLLMSFLMLLAILFLVGCTGGPGCPAAQFGASTCTPGAPGFGGGGGTGGTGGGGVGGGGGGGGGGTGGATAYAFVDVGGTIDELSLDTSAGTLLTPSGYTGPTTPSVSGWGMVVAQGQYLYTAFPGVGQIYGYTLSSGGTLTAIGGTPISAPYMIGSTLAGQQGMITNPAGTLLFVLNQSGDAVYIYQIGTGGTLTAAGSTLLPFLPENMATDGLGKYLYVTSASTDTSVTPAIAAYSISNGGSLTAVSGSPFSGNLGGVANAYGMLQVEGDPSGNYLIGTTSAVIGNNFLYVYGIQQTGSAAGAITPVSGSPFATVYSPYSIAVQPNTGGVFVYSFSLNGVGTGDNPIEGYQLNTSTGALTAIPGSPFATSAATGDSGQFDQTGTYLFVLNSTTTTMGVYNVGTTGDLTQPVASVGFFDAAWTVSDAP